MKISVVIGVIHMTVGVFIKATNSIYFKKKVEFWFETIPQLIFLVLVFGYMDFLIIFKWLKPWGYGNPHAPSIITSMINLPLMVGKTVIFLIDSGSRMLSWRLAYVGWNRQHKSRQYTEGYSGHRLSLCTYHAASKTDLRDQSTQKKIGWTSST